MPAPDPILLDIPTTLHTERLVLRLPEPGDGARIFPSVQASLAELRPWMPWARDPSPESIETWARGAIANFYKRTELTYVAWAQDDGRHIANLGTHHIDWSVPRFEIGYWCHSGESGRGYITEAVRALTQYLFDTLGAYRVEIKMDIRNVRSARVPERLGFALEGVLRQDARGVAGELRDTKIYARISAEGL